MDLRPAEHSLSCGGEFKAAGGIRWRLRRIGCPAGTLSRRHPNGAPGTDACRRSFRDSRRALSDGLNRQRGFWPTVTAPWYPDEDVVWAVHSALIALDPVDRKHPGLARQGEERLRGALESCTPDQGEGPDLLFHVAACLIYEINRRHPFDAANKRTALAVGTLFLERNGLVFVPPPGEAKAHMLAIREGRATRDDTRVWIQRWSGPAKS